MDNYREAFFSNVLVDNFLIPTTIDNDESFFTDSNQTFIELWDDKTTIFSHNRNFRTFLKEIVFVGFKKNILTANADSSYANLNDDQLFNIMVTNLASSKFSSKFDFITLFSGSGELSTTNANVIQLFLNTKVLSREKKLIWGNKGTGITKNNASDVFILPIFKSFNTINETLGYSDVGYQDDSDNIYDNVEINTNAIMTEGTSLTKEVSSDITWALQQIVFRIRKIRELRNEYSWYGREDFYNEFIKSNPNDLNKENGGAGKNILIIHQNKYQREVEKLPAYLVQALRIPFNILPFISTNNIASDESTTERNVYYDLDVIDRVELFLKNLENYETRYSKIKNSNIGELTLANVDTFSFVLSKDDTDFKELYKKENKKLLENIKEGFETIINEIEAEENAPEENTDEENETAKPKRQKLISTYNVYSDFKDKVIAAKKETETFINDIDAERSIEDQKKFTEAIQTLRDKLTIAENKMANMKFMIDYFGLFTEDDKDEVREVIKKDLIAKNAEDKYWDITPYYVNLIELNEGNDNDSEFDYSSMKVKLTSILNNQTLELPNRSEITNDKVWEALNSLKNDFDAKKEEVSNSLNDVNDKVSFINALTKLTQFITLSNNVHKKSLEVLKQIDNFSKLGYSDDVNEVLQTFDQNNPLSTLVNLYNNKFEEYKASILKDTQKEIHDLIIRGAKRLIERAKQNTSSFSNLNFGLEGFEESLRVYELEYFKMEQALKANRLTEALKISKELVSSNYNVQKEVEFLRDLIKLLDADNNALQYLNDKTPEIIAKLKESNSSEDQNDYKPTASDMLREYAKALNLYVEDVDTLRETIHSLNNAIDTISKLNPQATTNQKAINVINNINETLANAISKYDVNNQEYRDTLMEINRLLYIQTLDSKDNLETEIPAEEKQRLMQMNTQKLAQSTIEKLSNQLKNMSNTLELKNQEKEQELAKANKKFLTYVISSLVVFMLIAVILLSLYLKKRSALKASE